MSTLRPLALYPWPTDLNPVRAAKAALSVDYRVAPSPAAPGGPTRVLALRQAPPWLCDYALVGDPSNVESMVAALEWVLGDGDDDRATLIIDQLRAQFGPDVREIEDRSLDDLVDPIGPRFVERRRHDPND